GENGGLPIAVITASTATVCTTAMSTGGTRERSTTCHIGTAPSSRRRDSAGSSRKLPKAPSHSASAATKGKVAVVAPLAWFSRSREVSTGEAAISLIRERSSSV